MPTFQIVNRSPDNSTYFAQEGMTNWTFLPIVEMADRTFTFNGADIIFLKDYITLQVAGDVPGFPQLFFRLYGDFSFINKITSIGYGKFVAAGSIVDTVEVIDASGTVFNRLSGLNYAIPSDKTTDFIEPINLFANSFREQEMIGSNANVPTFMAGNDYVTGAGFTGGPEVLQGFAGHDSVGGGAGADEIWGDDRNGVMTGNDTLNGGGDADTVFGGRGDDLFVGYTTGDTFFGGDGRDTWSITGHATSGLSIPPQVDLRAALFSSIEELRIWGGNIRMTAAQLGNAGVLTIRGTDGVRDEMTVDVAGGVATNFAGLEFLNWNNGSGEFDLFTIYGSGSGDWIGGSRVNDNIYAGEGLNTVFGNSGRDYLSGGNLADTFYGGANDDSLSGWGGDDWLFGDDPGNRDDDGSDSLDGSWGNDTLTGYQGFNTLNGGADTDTVDYRWIPRVQAGGTPYGVTVDLATVINPTSDTTPFSAYGDINYGEISIPYLRDFLIGIENVIGSDRDDRIRGDGLANLFLGHDGNDTLDGRGGDDSLDGAHGIDSLQGGAGNDRLAGGPSGDSLDGGAGEDWLIYGRDAIGHTIRLWNGTATGGFAEGDRFVNIEHVTGSIRADIIIGSSGVNNSLLGESGDDYLDGLTGADWLDGGSGNDTAAYTGSTAGVTVRLWNGTGAGGAAQGDRLFGIEHLTGSTQADNLIGSDAVANRLTGGGGGDYLNGLSGADRLDGGAGNDTLDGAADGDQFVFGLGYGTDRVVAFQNGLDRVDLVGITFAQFTETAITGGVRLTGTGAAAGLILDLGGVTVAQVEAGDFI